MKSTSSSLLPTWFDPRMPDRSLCVLGQLLARAAESRPEHVFAVFNDGTEWTYAQVFHLARKHAAGLQQLGVEKGDRVLAWLPNGPDVLLTWFATNLLGACIVPINTAYRGQLLEHVVANTRARLMVTSGKLVERLRDIDLACLVSLVVTGDEPAEAISGLDVLPAAALEGNDADLEPATGLMPWDLQSIVYTSGTTGPSKGVMSSYFHQYTVATVLHGHMSESDRIFVNAPMFHVGGTGAVTAALIHSGSVAIVDGFKADTFWDRIRDTGSTLTSGLIGSMAPYLAKCATVADQTENRLRRTHFYPVSEETIEFARNFDFEYFSGYGMTELPMVMITDVNSTVLRSCGRPRSGVQCRLVDEHDQEVAPGESGELIVRSDQPWSLTHGYYGMPEATAEAWRNGWFHSGDLLRQDDAGNFYFVDRKKDAIRRRGENISSEEVEAVVHMHPDVQDAVAVAVPSEYGEDDVMVVVSSKDGPVDPAELFDFLQSRMAHFMLPRYIRIVSAMPKTPTDKIQKHKLRDEGVTDDTWDRESDGIRIKAAR
jgi:crotonobetaine/carnitine-CoA ligase